MTTKAIAKARRWPELEQAVDQLIRSRRSENTRRAYRSDWERWLAFTRIHGTDLVVPGLGATTTFRDELATAHGFSSKTIARILSTLSFLYGALRDTALVQHNPFAKAWLPRPDTTDVHKTPAVADDTVLRIVAAFAGDTTPAAIRDRAIFRVLYETGIRRSSLVDLRRSQLRRGEPWSAIVMVKGKREEIVEFTADTQAALEAWLAIAPSSPFVFPGRKPSAPLDLATVNNVINRRAAAIGLSGVTPHQFRTAFITTGFDAGVAPRSMQAAAHHKNLDTTIGYDRNARGGTVVDQISKYRKAKATERNNPTPVNETRRKKGT